MPATPTSENAEVRVNTYRWGKRQYSLRDLVQFLILYAGGNDLLQQCGEVMHHLRAHLRRKLRIHSCCFRLSCRVLSLPPYSFVERPSMTYSGAR